MQPVRMTEEERKKLASDIATAVVLKGCIAAGAAILAFVIVRAIIGAL